MPTSSAIPFWRKRRTWLLYAPLLIIGLLLCIALLCWHLSRTDPEWYQPMSIDDANFQKLIDDPRLVTDAHNAVERAPLGDQTFIVRQDQLNATITGTLSLEAAGHLAREAAPVLFFTPGHLTIAARLNRLPNANPGGGVITAQYAAHMVDPVPGDPHRLLQLTLEKVWIGRLRIPLSFVVSRQAEMLGAIEPTIDKFLPLAAGDPARDTRQAEVHEALTHAIAGDPFLPFFYMPKKKPLIIKDFQLTDGELSITIGLR